MCAYRRNTIQYITTRIINIIDKFVISHNLYTAICVCNVCECIAYIQQGKYI